MKRREPESGATTCRKCGAPTSDEWTRCCNKCYRPSVKAERRWILASRAQAHKEAAALRARGWQVVAESRGQNVFLHAQRGTQQGGIQ